MMALSAELSWSAASRHVWSGLSDRDEFRDTAVSPRPAQEVGLADRRTLSHPWRRMNFEPVPSLANVSSRVIFYRVMAVPTRVRMRVRINRTGIAEVFCTGGASAADPAIVVIRRRRLPAGREPKTIHGRSFAGEGW